MLPYLTSSSFSKLCVRSFIRGHHNFTCMNNSRCSWTSAPIPSPLLKGSSCLQVPIQWKSESRLKPDWPTILSQTNLKTRNTNYPLRSPPAANGLVTNALLCSFTVCRSLRSRRRSIHLLVYSVDNKLRTCIYGQHQLRTLGLQWRAGSGTGHWLTSPRATGRLLPLLLPPPPLALLLLGGQV